MKERYDRRWHELAESLRKQGKGKKSAHRPKKPEKLGVDPFKGDSTNTQRFIQDYEINLDYFRESLRKDWDKVSLVIPLLQGPANKWYQSIHPYVSEEGALEKVFPSIRKMSFALGKVFGNGWSQVLVDTPIGIALLGSGMI